MILSGNIEHTRKHCSLRTTKRWYAAQRWYVSVPQLNIDHVAQSIPQTIDKLDMPAFRALLQFGRADLTEECFPTQDDVLQKVRSTAARIRTQLPDYFKELPGKVSISLTIIKRGGMVPYIAIVAHWVNKAWEGKEGTLLFAEMGCDYTAEDVSLHVMRALKQYGLDNKDKVCRSSSTRCTVRLFVF
jgi:hypothetical protein